MSVEIKPNCKGLYYVFEVVAGEPVSSFIPANNRAIACIGFYDFVLARKKEHLNPKNYELHFCAYFDTHTMEITPCKDELCCTGENVREYLVNNGVFTSEVEDVIGDVANE